MTVASLNATKMTLIAIYSHKDGSEYVTVSGDVIDHAAMLGECVKRLTQRLKQCLYIGTDINRCELLRKQLNRWTESFASGKLTDFNCIVAEARSSLRPTSIIRSVAINGFTINGSVLETNAGTMFIQTTPALVDFVPKNKVKKLWKIMDIGMVGEEYRYSFICDNTAIIENPSRLFYTAIASLESYTRTVSTATGEQVGKYAATFELAHRKSKLKDIISKLKKLKNSEPDRISFSFSNHERTGRKNICSERNAKMLKLLMSDYVPPSECAEPAHNLSGIVGGWLR